MTNWDAIILELMEEHGIPLEESDYDLIEDKRLRALIRESKMPIIPRGYEPKPICKNHKRVHPRKTAKVQSFYNLEMAKCREEWERLGLIPTKEKTK